MEADITTQAVGLASSADFSILKLFIRADIIIYYCIKITALRLIIANNIMCSLHKNIPISNIIIKQTF